MKALTLRDTNELNDLEKIKFILKGYLIDYLETCYSYNFKNDDALQVVEVIIKKTKEESDFIFMRIGVSHINQEIYIYNLFLPKEDRGKNLAFGAVYILLQIAKMMHYNLVMHSMVDSFYNLMLKRGAKKTSIPDCLEITDNTYLGQ